MERAIGLDISYYDKVLRPNQSKEPIDFIIVRTGHSWNNTFYQDPEYENYLPHVEKIPVKMAYYYMDSGSSVDIQIDEFLDTISRADFEWDGFACDWEAGYNTISKPFAKKAVEWIEAVKAETGKKVVLYTNASLYEAYWKERGKPYPLWLSRPLEDWTLKNIKSQNTQPKLPEGRSTWKIWQFNWEINGLDWGLGRENAGDINVFNGTLEDMKFWLRGETPEPPMEEKVLVEKARLNKLINDVEELKRELGEFNRASSELMAWADNVITTSEIINESAESPTPEPEPVRYKTLYGLNVRSSPGVTDTNKVGSIPEGTIVSIIETKDIDGDLWGRFENGEEEEEWIALRYDNKDYVTKV